MTEDDQSRTKPKVRIDLKRDIDPYAYLADVLVRIDEHPNRRIDELLPDRWSAAAT